MKNLYLAPQLSHHKLLTYTLLLVLLAIPLSYSFSQTIGVRGHVSDTQGHPVPSATVVLSTDSASTQNLAFGITDLEGNFHLQNLNPEPPERWITIRCMGYAEARRRVRIGTSEPPIEFTLEESTTQVDEVVIKAEAPDIYFRGDTLVFVSEQFARGDEKNMADVIRRMPGMQVTSSGQVIYQGKKVEKLLVNGKEIFTGASSGVALNTLPPDFAGSVELLSYYAGDDLASAFKAKEQMALNLKSNREVSLSGNIEGSGGIYNKWLGRSSLLSLTPSLALTVILNGNNTGEAVYSLDDYIANMMDFDAITASGGGMLSLDFSNTERNLFSPPSNVYERLGAVGNINLTWRPNNKFRLRTNTLYNFNNATGANHSENIYFTEPNFTRTDQLDTTWRKTHFFTQSISLHWLATKYFSIDSRSRFDFRLNDERERKDNTTGTKTKTYLEEPNEKGYKFNQDLAFKMLYRQGLAYLNISGKYDQYGYQQDFSASKPVLPMHYDHQVDQWLAYHIQQNSNSKNGNIRAALGTFYPVYRDVLFKAEVMADYNRTHRTLAHSYHSTQRNRTLARLTLKPYVGFFKNKGLVRFNLGASLAYYAIPECPSTTLTKNTLLYIEPEGNLEFAFDNKHRLTITAKEYASASTGSLMNIDTIVSNYLTIAMPNRVDNPFFKTFQTKLSHYYLSLFHDITLLTQISYSYSRGSMSTVNSFRGETLEYYIINTPGQSQDVDIYISLTKGLGVLPLEIKIKPSYSYSIWDYYNAADTGQMFAHSTSPRMSLASKFKSFPLNFEIGGGYSFYYKDFMEKRINNFEHEWNADLALHFAYKGFNLSPRVYYESFLYGSIRRDIIDVDVTASYTFLKDWHLSLVAKKIRRLRTNQWYSTYFGSINQSRKLYHALPGYVMLSLSYSF